MKRLKPALETRGFEVAIFHATGMGGRAFESLAEQGAFACVFDFCTQELGNFINGELYGRVTESAIGMHFPMAPGTGLRHPSQLYEGFFEGIILWIILWSLRKHLKPDGAMLPAYLIGYGVFRFFIEYTRQPDAHLGFVFLNLSMGQILCLLMILAGGGLYLLLRKWEKRQNR